MTDHELTDVQSSRIRPQQSSPSTQHPPHQRPKPSSATWRINTATTSTAMTKPTTTTPTPSPPPSPPSSRPSSNTRKKAPGRSPHSSCPPTNTHAQALAPTNGAPTVCPPRNLRSASASSRRGRNRSPRRACRATRRSPTTLPTTPRLSAASCPLATAHKRSARAVRARALDTASATRSTMTRTLLRAPRATAMPVLARRRRRRRVMAVSRRRTGVDPLARRRMSVCRFGLLLCSPWVLSLLSALLLGRSIVWAAKSFRALSVPVLAGL